MVNFFRPSRYRLEADLEVRSEALDGYGKRFGARNPAESLPRSARKDCFKSHKLLLFSFGLFGVNLKGSPSLRTA